MVSFVLSYRIYTKTFIFLSVFSRWGGGVGGDGGRGGGGGASLAAPPGYFNYLVVARITSLCQGDFTNTHSHFGEKTHPLPPPPCPSPPSHSYSCIAGKNIRYRIELVESGNRMIWCCGRCHPVLPKWVSCELLLWNNDSLNSYQRKLILINRFKNPKSPRRLYHPKLCMFFSCHC